MKKWPIIAGIITAIIVLSGVTYYISQEKRPEVTVAVAGSLSLSFEQMEKNHPFIMVSKGSRAVYMDVLNVHKHYDVVGFADATLAKYLMQEGLMCYYVVPFSNKMVLVYTNSSKYADEINSTNWYEILEKPGVKFGFSNPNLDPCGYRTMIVNLLADQYYHKEIFEKLIEENTNIRHKGDEILVPEHVVCNTSKIVIRPKEVDLVSLVQQGIIDYVFEYRSVAVEHHLRYVELPDQIALSNPAYEKLYSSICVVFQNGKKIYGSTIKYAIGVTIYGKGNQAVENLMKYIFSKQGIRIFEEHGFVILKKVEVYGGAPDWLRQEVEQISSPSS